MRLKFQIIILSLFSYLAIQPALSQDYCNENGTVFSAYFAPRLGAGTQEIKNYQNGVESIFRKLQIGDKLEILLAHDAGITQSFSACFPGCPPQGVMDQFLGLGGSCKATLAKRDQIDFKRKFVSSIKRTIDDSQNKNFGYLNIIKTLGVVSTHANVENKEMTNTFLVSTMFNDAAINRTSANAFFVQTIQSEDMPDGFPEMQILGTSLNPDLIELWTDLYTVNNQKFNYN